MVLTVNIGMYFGHKNYCIVDGSGTQKRNLGFLECRTEQIMVTIKKGGI